MDTQVLLQTVLGEIKTPIFLAGFDRERSQLMLHVSEGHDLTNLRAAAQRAFVKAEESVKICVRSHRLSRLAHPRSLEHWLRQFDTDEIIYDPTMVMSRARGLLAASKACRLALGEAIGGLFFDPDRRTLFVLDTGRTAHSTATLAPRVRSIIEETGNQAISQRRDAIGPSWTSIQVVTELPRRELIPIDAKSTSLASGVRQKLRQWFAPIALALALAGIAVPASANVGAEQVGRQASGQANPAKATVNHKFGVLGGLAVFGDNAVPHELDLFASAGLQQYFGERVHHSEKGVRVAATQHRRRKRIPDEVGQVGGGGAAAPGS